MRKDLWDEVCTRAMTLTPWTGRGLVGVEGSPIRVHGVAEFRVSFGGKPSLMEVVVADSLKARAILGLDVLEANCRTIDAGNNPTIWKARILGATGKYIPAPSSEVHQPGAARDVASPSVQ